MPSSTVTQLVANRCRSMLKPPKQPQPMPLKDWRLETPDGIVSLKVQLKLKERGRSTFLVGSDGRVPLEVNVQTREFVEKLEHLKEAYLLESETGDRLFLFTNRESVASYLNAKFEEHETWARVKENYIKSKAETIAKLREVMRDIAQLEQRIEKTEKGFMDSEDNLAYTKAKNDLITYENRQRDLKAKLKDPVPERSLGSALSIQFAALEIVEKGSIVNAVKAEKTAILNKYRGLPDFSEIQLSRRLIASVTWKQ